MVAGNLGLFGFGNGFGNGFGIGLYIFFCVKVKYFCFIYCKYEVHDWFGYGFYKNFCENFIFLRGEML